MSEELKPCPNCGHKHPDWWQYDDIYRIECDGCGGCEMAGPKGEDLKTVIEAWNALPRRSDIERVERERDWLATQLAKTRIFRAPFRLPMTAEQWLKLAKESACPKN